MKKLPIYLEYVLEDIEVLDERIIDEKSGDKEVDVKAKFQHAGIVNINTRRYRRELLEREIAKTMKLIEANEPVYGLGYHPADGLGKPSDISHTWTKVWMNPDGVCEGELTILPTPLGKTIQTVIKGGRKLGISSRGFGTVTEKKEVINGEKVTFLDVNDDYDMKTPGDFVIAPAVPGAGNITKEMVILESKLNEGLDPIKTNAKIQKEDIMKLADFRKEHSEEVKQIEDEKEAALKAAAAEDKTVEEKDTKIAELEGDITTLKEEKVALEEKITALETKVEKYVNFMRTLISDTGEQEGVIPESDEDDPEAEPKGDKEPTKEMAETKQALEEAKTQIKALEDKNKEVEDAADAKKEATELQTQLRAKLDEELAKDDYKIHAVFIEDEVTDDDGIITIKSVDAVEDAVKKASERASKYKVENVQAEIAKDTVEKGRIENPEGGNEAVLKATHKALYKESVDAGFKGTFDEWKEKYPQLVASVSS